MADPKPGTFSFTSRDAKALMNSNQFRMIVRKNARVGLKAFQRHVNARGGSGAMARSARLEDGRGWDGRPATRIVVPRAGRGNPIAAEFGTRRSSAVHGLRAAIAAIERQGR
ncbi:hypothetical protein [Rhodococcus koreensis]|uniref:hypothetical protein n=1 Tax=Rhodococcus koreensis TaxID=99653 RepID=UPI00366BCE97